MPPKTKDKKKIPDLVVDGFNLTKMSQEQLVRHTIKVAKILTEVKKKRSFAEQERDVVYRKLESAREELDGCQADRIVRANQMEQKRTNHHAELKVHRQRANHLKYELDRDLAKAKAEQDAFLVENSRNHASALTEIFSHQLNSETRTNDAQRAYKQNTKEIIAVTERHHLKARDNYQTALIDRSEVLTLERDDLDELADLELRSFKNLVDQQRLEHISNLKKNFERNYHEIKHYFQELTYHNLTMIQDLTKQCDAIKGHFTDLYKRYKDILKETEQNREPLRLQTIKLAELKKQAETHKKDKFSLTRLQKNLEKLERRRSQLQLEVNECKEQHEKIQAEHAELRSSFGPAITEAKEVIGCDASLVREKACFVRDRVELLKESLRKRSESNRDAAAEDQLRQVQLIERRYFENILNQRELQLSYHKMAKLYNDALLTIRYIVEKHGLDLKGRIDLQPILIGTLSLKPTEIGRMGRNREHAVDAFIKNNHISE